MCVVAVVLGNDEPLVCMKMREIHLILQQLASFPLRTFSFCLLFLKAQRFSLLINGV